jgi:hypothetical protein
MQLEWAVSIGTLLTIGGLVVRVIFQSGIMANTLNALAEKVDDLIIESKGDATDAARLRAEFARLEGRVSSLERWRERPDHR